MPGYGADVGVRDGRIVKIGRIASGARASIDADGLTVTPGFIDVHTHYDVQLDWDPLATPSCWHGTTTVLTGNCGFTLAPAKPDDVDWLAGMLSRVEGMSRARAARGPASFAAAASATTGGASTAASASTSAATSATAPCAAG